MHVKQTWYTPPLSSSYIIQVYTCVHERSKYAKEAQNIRRGERPHTNNTTNNPQGTYLKNYSYT